jgi:hypothetical protein
LTQDPPQYQPPPPDPALAILTKQNEQQQYAAVQDRVSSASARLMTMYGTRTSMAGGSNNSPLAPLLAPQSGGFGAPLVGM